MELNVAVDTSFLMFIVRRKINMDRIYSAFDNPIKLYTSRGVINELEAISKSKRPSAVDAALALKLLNSLNIEIKPNTEDPDKWLMTQRVIATTDIKLAREAKLAGIRVISITKSNKIVIK